MKKLLLTFAMMMVLGLTFTMFSSCSDKDDSPAEDKQEETDYTIIVYGNAGGMMDFVIEEIWRETQTQLPDKKIRVVVEYKYGKDSEDFSGKYGNPGELVAFELDKDTKFEDIRSQGIELEEFPLYEPECLKSLLNFAKKYAPAKNYVLALYGHGGGFEAFLDYPKALQGKTRGVLYDELLDGEGMDMYELTEAISSSDIPHLKGIMFHNCHMGAIEIITEVAPFADYIITTPFALTADDCPMIPYLVKQLREKGDFEAAARQMLIDSKDRLTKGLYGEDTPMNGNVELLKSSEMDAVCKATKKLAKRLCELYPTHKESIDKATCQAYEFYKGDPYHDLLDYATKLAKETGDEQLASIQIQLADAFKKLIIYQITCDNGALAALPFYSLSVILMDHESYHETSDKGTFTYCDSYFLSDFHLLTGWGDWLDTNLCSPTGNPYGQSE